MDTLLANNGNVLAEIMHGNQLLKDGMSVEECERVARANTIIPPFAEKWLTRDDFWEDFIFRVDEFGYKLKL